MNDTLQWNHTLAMEYFAEFAKFEKVRIEECIKLNTAQKIRGKVGAAEFEYRENEKIFIVRGLINKRISKANIRFKNMLIERLMAMNDFAREEYDGATFEFDTTAHELNEDFPERINLRIDFSHPVEAKKFIKKADALTDNSYRFSQNKYPKITSEINRIVFPPKTIRKE